MGTPPETLWTRQGVTCDAARTGNGFEVSVRTGEFPPLLRKTARSRSDARNQGEYLRLLLDRRGDPMPPARARPPLVLIVEDDPDTLSAYEEMLKIEGFYSVSARTLADARRLIREVRPAAVLLDHLLPDGYGASVCAELRHARINALPIVLVTGADPRSVVLGGAECPDAVLTKPCRAEMVTAVVKLLIQRPKNASTRQPAAVRPPGTMSVRCPACGAPDAHLGAHGSFLCPTCGKKGVLDRDQFIDLA